jgi:hypothetical protein
MSSTSSSLYRSNISKRRRSLESVTLPSICGDMQDDWDSEQLDTQSHQNDTPATARTFKSLCDKSLLCFSLCLQTDISDRPPIHA